MELFTSSFIFDILIIEQKALSKLLNKNIFKKHPYSLEKTKLIIGLVNRNISVLLNVAETILKETSNIYLK